MHQRPVERPPKFSQEVRQYQLLSDLLGGADIEVTPYTRQNCLALG